MNRLPRIGLLLCYLKLYDDNMLELRERFQPLIELIQDRLAQENIEVHVSKICRLRTEFIHAVEDFHEKDVDLIVTLHLAYSLSLEAIEALETLRVPILLLDTTMDASFSQRVEPERLMYNHGVHGVQDLASVLRQRKVLYSVVAGHVIESNVLQRTAEHARAAYAARSFKQSKVLRIGEPFAGMGDFAVPPLVLKARFGIVANQVAAESIHAEVEAVSENDLLEELKADRERYQVEVDEQVHRRSVRVGLSLRRYLEQGEYDAFNLNFLEFNSDQPPWDTVPFLEASKAMARGIGYAGEGDVLTAALVGALQRAFGQTTFTEIFCPDWQGQSLFLSHMGEINPETVADQALLCEKDFPWTGASNPAILAGALQPGPAVFVNLAPGPEETFRMIIAPVEVLPDETSEAWRTTIRGWIQPKTPINELLERFSEYGGTHHSALVFGDHLEALRAFARYLSIEFKTIP